MLYFGFTKLKHSMSKGMETHGKKNGEIKFADSRTFGLTFKEVLLLDSTTIRLFSDILKGVGRNPENISGKESIFSCCIFSVYTCDKLTGCV
jgi:hypothetical protein